MIIAVYNRLIHKTKVLRINENIFSRILQKNAYPLATVVDNLHKNFKNVAKGNNLVPRASSLS